MTILGYFFESLLLMVLGACVHTISCQEEGSEEEGVKFSVSHPFNLVF